VRLDGSPVSNRALAEQVKSILASKRLTLYEASHRSITLFGRWSPYYVPHNLYYDLRRETYSPSLFQLFALSQISGYSLSDWLRVFGFETEWIPRLQLQFPSERTVLLDSSLDDPNVFVSWLRDLPNAVPPVGVFSLSQVLEWTRPRRLGSLQRRLAGEFLYAKIGHADALAFPDLLPGSIARVRRGMCDDLLNRFSDEGAKNLFLIEHNKGLCCCRFKVVGNGRIVLASTQLPYASVEFRVPQEARVVGIVDLEIRNLVKPQLPVLGDSCTKSRALEALSPQPSQFGPLLRWARLRRGLSFRAASTITRKIADLLADDRYFIAPGSLSDYETTDIPPRHFQKIVTFCVVYALAFDILLKSLGLRLENAGEEPIPDGFMGRPSVVTTQESAEPEEAGPSELLAEMTAQFEEVPFFLRGSLRTLTSLQRLSLKDFFWMGPGRNDPQPYLAGALLAVVNRRQKQPSDCEKKPLWQQPSYLILKRDGTYLCGCCSRNNNTLIVHSYPNGVHRREQFRTRDAEVIGRIVLVTRKMT